MGNKDSTLITQLMKALKNHTSHPDLESGSLPRGYRASWRSRIKYRITETQS
jgi:hypothetical protein